MAKTVIKTETRTEWVRSQKVDKSKRTAKTSNIDTQNIRTGTRTRKNVNYKSVENGKTQIIKRRSVNTAASRAKVPRVHRGRTN
jgi:hypothetical protein